MIKVEQGGFMGRRKIQDESEVIRWFEEGRTYQWMIEEYRRKYDIETVVSMWGNFRRRRGLDRRIVRNDDLIPWFVKEEHRWAYPLAMLRAEGRRRAGKELTETDESRLASWLGMLKKKGSVVHYDPDTEEGFSYVPRQAGDNDMIRRPDTKTTPRPNADKG
ncbi:hypothetical protein OG373_06340 [Streptomyces avidinii]|uniref:hypothetical protein n=1 Tax=Streptomyces avidinii TaxID=1895 RepID=UPI00386CF7BF|nr:hypothetical protein OG373_06340 [Streptomyces avidinii]